MAGGYKRQIVRSDEEAAVVSHVRLAIFATRAHPRTDVRANETVVKSSAICLIEIFAVLFHKW